MDTEADENSRTIFCANLHKRVTEEILYELFLQAGPVSRVRIPSNNNYGFVTYQHLCSVEYALDVFKDTELYGNSLILKRRQIRNKDDSNNVPNNNQNSNYNSVLQSGNDFVHMSNMYHNMAPQNLMQQTFCNVYQNSNYHSNQPHKHDRSRSPPRNRHNYRQDHGSNQTPRGRYDNNRHNKRYDYDNKYDHRSNHNDRHSRKRNKR